MAPIIEVSNETLNTLNPNFYILRRDLEKYKDNNSDFIYVPSINLYVAKRRTHLGKDWNESQTLLYAANQKMLTLLEFCEFLKYTKENHKDIYNEITEVRDPWRSEWLDTHFNVKGKDLFVNYHLFDSNGKIIKKSEILNKNTLMKEIDSEISLDDWLKNSTKQGLPNKKVRSRGALHYWAPNKHDNSVMQFKAFDYELVLHCNRDTRDTHHTRGVRATKLRE